MRLPTPLAPPYDIGAWKERPFPERLRMVCQAWARDGYGTPWPVYGFYGLKIALYIGMWVFFVGFTPGLGGLSRLGSWWSNPVAFQKSVVWSLAFEGLGLGCGSGPLTGRYLPPIAAALYFVRPGTTKLPLVPGIPVFGGDRRTVLDVALYLAHYACLARLLVAPVVTPALLVPTALLLPLLGLTDKTLFLSARAEHYFTALVAFSFTGWVGAAKLLWVLVWIGAASSKLNRHFPFVLAVMQSNSPLTSVFGLRKRLFARYPDDLRPSRMTFALAHAGTFVEFVFPMVLLANFGGPFTHAALVVMLVFHAFITLSIPMGVPLEWNLLMVYGGFFLFGHEAATSVFSMGSPLLLGWIALNGVVIPVLGNLFPARFSFLSSMRYYAGNWGYSVWLFRGSSAERLDHGLVTSAPRVELQLRRFYDEDTVTAVLSKVMAFRAMHLHGRALPELLGKAVDDLDAYHYVDGELVAGGVLGWNFGDGHLHDERLLGAIQRQCAFLPGELRCVFVESQPALTPTLAYRIVDAATGEIERGNVDVRALVSRQPWPIAASPVGLAKATS